MARARVLHAEEGDDVTRLGRIELNASISVHFDNTADTFVLAGERIQNAVAFLQCARINARKGQGAETVIHYLERQRPQWFTRIDLREASRLIAFEIDFRLRFHFRRVRQIVNNCIKNILYTFVFKGSTTVSRKEIERNSALADTTLEIFD